MTLAPPAAGMMPRYRPGSPMDGADLAMPPMVAPGVPCIALAQASSDMLTPICKGGSVSPYLLSEDSMFGLGCAAECQSGIRRGTCMRVFSVSRGWRTSVEVLLAMPPASAARTRSLPTPGSAAGGPAHRRAGWLHRPRTGCSEQPSSKLAMILSSCSRELTRHARMYTTLWRGRRL